MIPALIQLIIWLLIVGILYWLVVYVVDNFIPDPPGRAIKVVVLVVLVIAVILALLDILGVHTGVNMPKMG